MSWTSTRTSSWWATNVRVGWEGTTGGVRLAPFLGIKLIDLALGALHVTGGVP